jgi:Zn-dependent protease
MAAFARGYLRIGAWRGAPVLLHWSIVLGALFFGGFRFEPAFWAAFFGLILLHELGHAFFVRRFGQRLISVEVHGLGGLCTWSGRVSPVQRAVIAWGGVVAQSLVLVGAALFLATHGPPETLAGRQVLAVATWTNVFMIALNLIPVRPLDGAEAWPLIPLLWNRRRLREAMAADARAREARALSRAKLKEADAREDAAADEPPEEIAGRVDDVLRRAKDEKT